MFRIYAVPSIMKTFSGGHDGDTITGIPNMGGGGPMYGLGWRFIGITFSYVIFLVCCQYLH